MQTSAWSRLVGVKLTFQRCVSGCRRGITRRRFIGGTGSGRKAGIGPGRGTGQTPWFLRQKSRGESGTALVLMTLFVVAIFAFAALSVDVANVLREQRKAQIATDAGALTATLQLTNTLQDVNSIRAAGVDIAGANGVTPAEIEASNAGTIEVGAWLNGQFQAGQKVNGLYNAVRVPARRNVPLNFGQIIGMNAMNPAVHSVAAIGAAGQVYNPIPLWVTASAVVGHPYGDFLTLLPGDFYDPKTGNGQWGKINFKDSNGNNKYQTKNDWLKDMTTNGCSCPVSVGTYDDMTGSSGVQSAVQALMGAEVTIPVVDTPPKSGSTAVNVIGFIQIRVTATGPGGSNWFLTGLFLDTATASGPGGTCPPPCIQGARALVE
jgi:hypothetical protein